VRRIDNDVGSKPDSDSFWMSPNFPHDATIDGAAPA
jgi:hypothetical protein